MAKPTNETKSTRKYTRKADAERNSANVVLSNDERDKVLSYASALTSQTGLKVSLTDAVAAIFRKGLQSV
jgi:hypothetical protein